MTSTEKQTCDTCLSFRPCQGNCWCKDWLVTSTRYAIVERDRPACERYRYSKIKATAKEQCS